MMNIKDDRPEIFAGAEANIWTDPYIQEQMLKCHLDPASDAASRSVGAIERTVEFITREIQAGGRLLDLGCGPGLYAERFARRGYQVTGIDFNRKSIEYAVSRNNPEIRYIHGDYIQDFPAGEFDAVIMIYCDMGTHGPEARDLLLRNCRSALAPGGKLIFDVFGPGLAGDRKEGRDWSYFPAAGFWSDSEHLVLQQTFHYPAEQVFAYQYNLITGNRAKHFIVWEKYYTEAEITGVLKRAGFSRVDIRQNILPDNSFTSNAAMFVVAEK